MNKINSVLCWSLLDLQNLEGMVGSGVKKRDILDTYKYWITKCVLRMFAISFHFFTAFRLYDFRLFFCCLVFDTIEFSC